MANLAINGGPKFIDKPIGRPWPEFGNPEREALNDVLESRVWWRGGHSRPEDSWVGRFESFFARFQDCDYGVACTNGTQAIELALKAIGIKPGDEVICPASTFVATATAVIMVNAIPVIVDIEPDYYQIDPRAIEAAITPRTAGIIPVHYGGYPADMDAINGIAKQHNLFVIEDCAHAHGSQWKGKGCGSLGDIGCFSLQMGKTLTCGEGGVVTTNDADLAGKLFAFHHIGRFPGRPFYEHHIVASNLRMTEFQGAVAYCQAQRLLEQTFRREENAKYFEAGLREIKGVAPMERRPEVTRWGFYFYHFKYLSDLVGGLSKQRFQEALATEGLGTGSGHLHPIQKNPLFTNRNFGPVCWPAGIDAPNYEKIETPVAERILAHEGISMSHQAFLGTREDMDMMLGAIRKVIENADELR